MPYSQMFKYKMIQKMIGLDAISATALSKKIDVPLDTFRMAAKSRNRFIVCLSEPTEWKYAHDPQNTQ